MLINVKMTTIVVILTYMSMVKFMLSWVEHKKFYNLGTGPQGYKAFFMVFSIKHEFQRLIKI